MRIIAGKAKRLQLKVPRGWTGRPTLDRVREAQKLVKRGTPKTEACKRVRIDPRTFDRYVDIEEESED